MLDEPSVAEERIKLQEQLQGSPDDPERNFNYARFCIRNGDFHEAGPYLDKALLAEPGNRLYLQQRLSLHRTLAEHARAIEIGQRLLAMEAGDGVVWSQVAGAQAGVKQWDDAIKSSRKAIELLPKQVVLREEHHHLLREAGRWDDLIRFLEETKAERLEMPHLDVWMAQALADADRHRDALQAYRKLAEVKPEEWLFWGKIALLSERLGLPGEAEEARERLRGLSRIGKALPFTREEVKHGEVTLSVLELPPTPEEESTRYMFTHGQAGGGFRETVAELEVRKAKGKPWEPAQLEQGARYFVLSCRRGPRIGYLAVFAKQPDYGQVRQLVLNYLDKNREPSVYPADDE